MGLLRASEIFRECTRMLFDQLWPPLLRWPFIVSASTVTVGDWLIPGLLLLLFVLLLLTSSSFEPGTGALLGVTNCSKFGSGRSANWVEGEEASGCRPFHIFSASALAFSRISCCCSGERPGMEMSSRRKLVGPDCRDLLVWRNFRFRNGTHYDHGSRIVVCGPAAAVERAEERAHLGAEGLWWRGGHVVHGERACVLTAAASSNR
jgi:hypothetical protein